MDIPIRHGAAKAAVSALAIVVIVVVAAVLLLTLPRGPASTSSGTTASSSVSGTSSSRDRSTVSSSTLSSSSSSTTQSSTTSRTAISPLGAGNYTFAQPSFYVAIDGSDSWSGTLASPNAAGTDGPFATLQRAQAAADALEGSQPARAVPVGIEIGNGTYELQAPLSLTAMDSGTAASPIVWEAAPGSTVVVSGGQQVTGWTRVSGEEWAAPAAGFQNFEQMWKDGQRIFRPSTTNGTYLYFASTVMSKFKSQPCSAQVGTQYECFDRFEFRPGDIVGTYHNINAVEVDDFECWTMPVLRLKSVDLSNDTAFLTGTTSRTTSCHGFITGHRYLLENVKEDLSPGQWYYDSTNGQVLYMARPGEDPNTETFVAPQIGQLVLGRGVSHVEFLGLTFSYSDWVVPPSGWTSPQGEELTSKGQLPAALNFTASSYVTLANVTLSHMSAYALSFTGSAPFTTSALAHYDDVFINGRIYDTGAGGIVVGRAPSATDTDSGVAQHVLIWNSVVADIGRFLPGGNGVYILNSHDNVVGHDVIYGTYSNAVSVGGTYSYNAALPQLAHDNLVEYVLAFDVNQGVAEDGGALYTASGTAQGNVLKDNVVHDVVADINASIHGYGGWGIYFDSTSQNVVAEDTLVYRTSFPSIHQNDGFNNTVTNNILAFGGEGIIDRTHNNASSLIVTHNIVYYDNGYVLGSMQRGVWECSATCTSQFTFSSNLYWFAGGQPVFYTSMPQKDYDFQQWQSLGEDAGSVVANPLFANPQGSDFSLPSNSPAFSVGFVPFDPSQAGLLGGASYAVPFVPQSFTTTVAPPSGF